MNYFIKMINNKNYEFGRIIYLSILDNNKKILIEENCDNHFSIQLSKKQFKLFIDELKEIHDLLEEDL